MNENETYQNETFKMTYSAKQQEEIEAIRKKYAPKEEDKMEQLRALDAKVSRKATMVSILIGVIGTIVMGCGMSLVMSDFGSVLGKAAFPLGIAVGVTGMGVLALAYPVYNRTLKQERAKAAPEILRLTEELMK